jgi:hypothetical protein
MFLDAAGGFAFADENEANYAESISEVVHQIENQFNFVRHANQPLFSRAGDR